MSKSKWFWGVEESIILLIFLWKEQYTFEFHQPIFSMIFGTLSFRGCGGQLLALEWNIRVKRQMSTATEHEKSTKLLILLPLRTIYFRTYETPCRSFCPWWLIDWDLSNFEYLFWFFQLRLLLENNNKYSKKGIWQWSNSYKLLHILFLYVPI